MTRELTPGDEWPNHYRGYRLQTNPDGEMWWQAYQGTDRLFLDPTPDDLVEAMLDLKRLGGRIRITEGNDVLTKTEEGDEYETLWVGRATLSGELVPPDAPEFSVPLRPDGLDPGDFWPSVYDGAKYSFGAGLDRIWWSSADTHRNHPVRTSLSSDVTNTLSRLKPQGGSFRVTPWSDVLTLVDVDDLPSETQSQFDDLPRVVKNLIALRKKRGGVQKLPIYAGELEETPLVVDEPPSLTDPFPPGQAGVDDWVESLGTTAPTDPDEHSVDEPRDRDEGDEPAIPDDDPIDW